jgi:hypothetical protein
VVKLNEAPAGHWIYVFRLVANPSKGEIDSARVVFDRERGLLFASEEHLLPEWIRHIDLWIAEANAQVAADEAAEEKRRAESEARDRRDVLLKQINDKYKNLSLATAPSRGACPLVEEDDGGRLAFLRHVGSHEAPAGVSQHGASTDTTALQRRLSRSRRSRRRVSV